MPYSELAINVSKRHQDLLAWLGSILQIYTRRRDLGWVGLAPFPMHLQNPERQYTPDLLFIRNEHLERLGDQSLAGAPDLIVEISSTTSISRDRGEKFIAYEGAGVPEYWLIDPIRRQAEFYILAQDNLYYPILPDTDGIYRSRSIAELWLQIDWLWQDPLPDELMVLVALKILEM